MEEPPKEPQKGVAERIGFLIAIALVIAIPVVGVWALIEMFPADVPRKEDPGYVDVVFQNRVVVFAARLVVFSAALVLLLGAIYMAASTIVRIKRGQWLRRAGPFESELSEAQQGLSEVAALLDELNEAWEANEDLSRRLEERDRQLAGVYGDLERLSEELENASRRKGA
jgi:hypothetical protein